MSVKTKIAGAVIAVLVLSEVAWFVAPSHKSLMGESYRNHERIDALAQYAQHPSPATKSAVDRETDLLYDYVGKRNALFFASLLLLDCVLVFIVWRLDRRRTDPTATGT